MQTSRYSTLLSRRDRSHGMLRLGSRLAVCFLTLLLFTACHENRATNSNSAQQNAVFEGEWIATGPQSIGGYRAGDYTLSLRLLAKGKCTATVASNYRHVTALVDSPFSEVIYLSGEWEMKQNLLITSLNVDAWNFHHPPLEKGSAPKERFGRPSHDRLERYPIKWEWRADGNQLSNTALGSATVYRRDPKSTAETMNHAIRLYKPVAVRSHKSIPSLHHENYTPIRDKDSETGENPLRVNDPVGEWSNQGNHPKLSLCLWESGEAAGEFQSSDLAIHFEGKWRMIPDGRWKGHIMLDAAVTYWGDGQENVTPKHEKFSFMFDPAENQLRYVRGEPLADRHGRLFHPSGEAANNDPVLRRINSNRPIHRESGNH